MIDLMTLSDNQSLPLEAISSREMQVLGLTSQGFSTQEIASKLYLSGETVKSHRRNLLIKLKARNAAHLVRKGIEYNLIHM